MARVSIVRLSPTDARGVADVNTSFDNIETQSTNLDAMNFRREGIDNIAMRSDVIQFEWFTPITMTTVATYAPGAAWVTLNPGTNFLVASPSTLQTNEYGVVDFSCQMVTDLTGVGVPANTRIAFRVEILDNGVPTLLSLDHEWIAGNQSNSCCVRIRCGFLGTNNVLSNLKIQVIGTAATNYRIGYAELIGTVYRV